MKTDYHSILRRQLKRLKLSAEQPPQDARQWRALLERIDAYYEQVDEDRYLIERSLELSSLEMREMYDELERRSSSQLARLNEQLKHASESKTMFLANMSHELRTPLHTIIGYVGLIEEEAEELGASVLSSDLDKVNIAARHLLQLINSILDLSKIEAGELEVHLTWVDMARFVEELRATLEPLVTYQSNTLIVELSMPQQLLRTDELKLKQVLINLISNAAKFTSSGAITLRIYQAPGERTWTYFEVRDTGMGIPQEKLDELFGAFKQLDNQETIAAGGTGLGLTISRDLVELLGGHIEVTSELGQGTTFCVALPCLSHDDPP